MIFYSILVIVLLAMIAFFNSIRKKTIEQTMSEHWIGEQKIDKKGYNV